MQLGTHAAYACYIIEQTLAVGSFIRNWLYSKKNFRAAGMENLYSILKYFLPAAIPFNFFTTEHHFHSTKLLRDRISKIRNLLAIVPNLIKFGGISHHNQPTARKTEIVFISRKFPLRIRVTLKTFG